MRGGRIRPGRWTGSRRVPVVDVEPPPVAPRTVKQIPRLGGTFTTGATRSEAENMMRAHREGREVAPEETLDGMARLGRVAEGSIALGSSPSEAKAALKAAKAAGAIPAAKPRRSFVAYVARAPTTARDLPDEEE